MGGRSLQVWWVQILKEKEHKCFCCCCCCCCQKSKTKQRACVSAICWCFSHVLQEVSMLLQFNMSKENCRQTRQNENDSLGFSSETFWEFTEKVFSALRGTNIRVLEELYKDSLKKEILFRLKSEWLGDEFCQIPRFCIPGRPEIYALHHDEDIWVCNLGFSFDSNTFHSSWLTSSVQMWPQ